jgi:hypothetical protein
MAVIWSKSDYRYVSGYNPKPELTDNLEDISQELTVLRRLLPTARNMKHHPNFMAMISTGAIGLPEGMERWILMPEWRYVDTMYIMALMRLMNLVVQERDGNFVNWIHKKMQQSLLISESVDHAIWSQQRERSGLLLMPVQLGCRYQGKSVSEARTSFAKNEFGLNAFQGMVIALTHPERFQHRDDVWMLCPGDEFSVSRDGNRTVPYLRFYNGRMEFGDYSIDYSYPGFGVATFSS